jgi:hypothetical protein
MVSIKSGYITGYIGEFWLQWQLMKRGLLTVKMPNEMCCADLIAENGLRIEVKSAKPSKGRRTHKGKLYEWDKWAFSNYSRIQYYEKGARVRQKIIDRHLVCDYFVFICMDKDMNIERVYMIPQEVVGKRRGVIIPKVAKFKKGGIEFKEWRNRWDLLTATPRA